MFTYSCHFIGSSGEINFVWDFNADNHAEAIGIGVGNIEHPEDCEVIEIFLGQVRVFSTTARVAHPVASDLCA